MLAANDLVILALFVLGIIYLRANRLVPILYSAHSHIDPSLKRVLESFDVRPTAHATVSDVVFPPPNTPDAKLPEIKAQLTPGQLVCLVSGEDKLDSHFNLWTAFENRFGRAKACKYMPESFIIRGDGVTDDYEEFLHQKMGDNRTIYFLKNEVGSIHGIYLSNADLADVLGELSNNTAAARNFADVMRPDLAANMRALAPDKRDSSAYTTIQKCIRRPMLFKNRTFKLRLYLVFTNYQAQTACFLHRNGLVYYAKERYNPDVASPETVLASKRRMQKGRTSAEANRLYAPYPKTVQGLIGALKESGHDASSLFSSIVDLVKTFQGVAKDHLGNLLPEHSTFHLYNIDVVVDQNLRPYLLKFNRATPPDKPTTIEEIVHRQAWEDALKIHRFVLDDRPSGFTRVGAE